MVGVEVLGDAGGLCLVWSFQNDLVIDSLLHVYGSSELQACDVSGVGADKLRE